MAVCLALSFAIGCRARDATRPPQKLNVVIVLSDALRAASLSLYGYPRNTTPRLSELARGSIVFGSHQAHYPGTSVSVSQIMTSRLMSPLLISYKYIAVPVRGIPKDLLILPREFSSAGYRTGLVTSHYWFRANDTLLVRYFESTAMVPPPEHQSYAYFESLWPALTAFLDGARHDARPFFLYVHSLDTHGPNAYHAGFDQYRGAADWPEAYNLYDSEISYTDHWVGKLVDELRGRGLLDRTIFVFTADHGDEFNEMGPEKWNSNHGPWVRRALMHVPLIMRLPGDPSPGRRYEGLTRHIDLAPTLLRLAVPGFDLQPYRVDGEDLSGELLRGGTGGDTHRTSFAYSPRYRGLSQRDVEIHYDQWTDTFSPLYRPVPDSHNYPRLEPVENAALRAQLMEQLAHESQARMREFFALPPNEDLPTPALMGFFPPVMRVDHPDSGDRDASIPTFENLPDDNRWTLEPTSLLESHPNEHPGPLVLFTPWVPGKYRVSILLHHAEIHSYQNQFRIHFLNSGNAPVQLRGADASADGVLDAGVQTLGTTLGMQISEPQGGVAIAGLKLERLDAHAPPPQSDDALKERLRALGYVE